MAPRNRRIAIGLFVVATFALWFFFSQRHETKAVQEDPAFTASPATSPPITEPTPGDLLLAGYGDSNTPPIEDLKKIHRVSKGYFTVIKEASRYPIGGNADLSAALRGENPNQEVFIPPTHSVFSSDGFLTDRWNTPIVVHPEAWGQLELRSAGPDRKPYTGDDLILSPAGKQLPATK